MTSLEGDTLLLKSKQRNVKKENNFSRVLKTQRSTTSTKSDTLRRNTPLPSLRLRNPDARLVSKRGRVRIYFKNIPQKSLRYAKDLWNTLIDLQWRWLLLIVVLVNVLAYACSGILFYIDSWISGDFDDNPDYTCMIGTQTIRSYFMLGIETMTTTGYGYLHPTENCEFYFVALAFSTLTSIIVDGMFVSVVYAKLNRPKETNIYGQILSKKAVVALRNGRFCFIVRVNDRDGKHWINTDVRMYLIKDKGIQEGEIMSNHMEELEIKPFGMLFWPLDIVHEIGPESPLWKVSAKELRTTRLEIIIVLSGSSVKTGQSTRSQTSYLNKEIMWGYQFVPCLDYDDIKTEYVVNKKYFQSIVPQEMPFCSAKDLAELQERNGESRRKSIDCSCSHVKAKSEENIFISHEV